MNNSRSHQMLVDRLLGIEEPFSRFPLDSESSTKPESSQEHVPQDFLSSLDKWVEDETSRNPSNSMQIKNVKNRIIEAKRNSLKKLELKGYGLKSLPPCIEQLTDLEYLDLCGNRLESIPPSLFKLTNLKALDLSDNQITDVPNSIVDLRNLEELYLKSNKIESLPDLHELEGLKRLNLSHNKIARMPKLPVDLYSLNGYVDKGKSPEDLEKTFFLTINPELARESASAPAQTHFKQDPNPAQSISINYLQYIDYIENQPFVDKPKKEIIPGLSQDSGENQELKKPIQTFIDLLNQWEEQEKRQNPDNHKQIRQAKILIIEAKRNSHKRLGLIGCGLTSLPQCIDQLTDLEYLDLCGNRLESSLSSLFKLANLKVLDLSQNQIKEIPNSIKGLTNLEELSLKHNQINLLPDLDELTRLRKLDVSYNKEIKISKLPCSVSVTPRLGVAPSDTSWGKEPSSLPDPSNPRYRESFANHETTYLRSLNNPGIPLSPPAATTGPRSDNAPVSKPTCLGSCAIQ